MDILQTQNILNIYIGYDEVEKVAYHTLSQSIIKHASSPVRISPICSKHFRKFFIEQKIRNHLMIFLLHAF